MSMPLILYAVTPYLLLHFNLFNFNLLPFYLISSSSDFHQDPCLIFPFCNAALTSGVLPPSLSPDVGIDVTEDERKTESCPAPCFNAHAYPGPEQLLQIKFTFLV